MVTPSSRIAIETAETMLLSSEDPHCLPNELIRRLTRVNNLCSKCNGGLLLSRQVIAMIIEQWERDRK